MSIRDQDLEPPHRWSARSAERPLLADAAPLAADTAARLLGVTLAHLQAWEQRFGFPAPSGPTDASCYDAAQVLALRAALDRTSSVAAAVEIARRRLRPLTDEDLGAAFQAPQRSVDR